MIGDNFRTLTEICLNRHKIATYTIALIGFIDLSQDLSYYRHLYHHNNQFKPY